MQCTLSMGIEGGGMYRLICTWRITFLGQAVLFMYFGNDYC